MITKSKIAVGASFVLVVFISSSQFGASVKSDETRAFGNTKQLSSQIDPSGLSQEINATENGIEQSIQPIEDFQALLQYGQFLDSLISAKTSERKFVQKEFYRRLAIAVAKKDGRFRWNILYGIWMRESALDRKNFKGDGIPGKDGETIWKAFGVGQVHIPTGKTHYDTSVTEHDLLDPIKGGFASGRVLGDYITMFKGNVIAGISAYNQGPVYTKRHLKNRQPLKNLNYVTDVLYFAATALTTDSAGLAISKY